MGGCGEVTSWSRRDKGVCFQLVTLPCGCVVDADGSYVYEDTYLFCPWCLAVWLFDEAFPWIAANGDTHVATFARGGYGIYRLDDDVLEYIERCEDCGALILRLVKFSHAAERRRADRNEDENDRLLHIKVDDEYIADEETFLEQLEKLRN